MTTTALTLLGALLLDALLGDPRRWHPLAGFGRLAAWLESRLNRGRRRHLRGLAALLLLVTPFTLAAALLEGLTPIAGLLLLYLVLGGRSLAMHARQVVDALRQGDLEASRERVGWMVSRETAGMQRSDIVRASIESVLENGSDAVFGALFWFLVAGAPGAVAYRLVNTLDAMWGYRNRRFRRFGWAAARLDDLLNLIPARLTALSYALVGAFQPALRCWGAQAAAWESPNAGPAMAAGAGALGVRLGGPAVYRGETRQRPRLGCGREPESDDIERATALVRNSLLLWGMLVAAGGWCLA